MELAFFAAAFGFALAARAIGLPPLVGYLVAGFVLHGFGYEATDTIDGISDVGVLLLLFGIGLKLRLRTLARPAVWVTASTFAIVSTAVFTTALLGLGALGLALAEDLDLRSAAIVGFAFSFSSTVFAIKALERTAESTSLAGRLAVGVLVLQDVMAVAFLVATGSERPTVWAFLVIPGIAVLRPIVGWLLDRSDHGEILTLLGFALAIGVGAGSFELVGLKPDLGALIAGVMLAGHPRAGELADRLLGFKDLFLVGFFLSIGLQGTPSPASWVIAALALALVPARSMGFFFLFTRFSLRARTALHTSLTLSTYSEFGLIVGAAALASGYIDQDWISTIALAVAASFVVASTANTSRYRLYGRWSSKLVGFERSEIIAEDAIFDFGDARVVIFGMGRVGAGAYDEMTLRRGPLVIGIDRTDEKVTMHREAGRSVIRGDALDWDFWERVRFHPEIELVVASMSSHGANIECVKRVREFLPNARIAAIATYPDQVAELRDAGVDVARNLYEEAGQALADDAVAELFTDDG